MDRLIYDGQMPCSDNSILYMFISENLEDAAEIFYDLYEDDIHSVVEDYKSDEDELYGLTLSLELNKGGSVISVLLSISVEDANEEITEYEVAEIELDSDNIEKLLSKIEVANLA